MLSRLTPIAIAILVTGTPLALNVSAASAAGGGACGPQMGICANNGTKNPGRTAPRGGGGGGGGGGGKAAPIPCPGAVNCNAIGAGVAPPVQIPTQDVAYMARNQLVLPAPTLNTSPTGKTYVQLRTALWVNPGQYVTKTAIAAVPGQTVTAYGVPDNITWNMGEGTVVCHAAGSRRGTQCGYTYQRSSANRPGGKYAISVSITWNVHWECAGACDANYGTFDPPTMTMTTNDTLAVGEVQTESRPG